MHGCLFDDKSYAEGVITIGWPKNFNNIFSNTLVSIYSILLDEIHVNINNNMGSVSKLGKLT